MNLKLIIIVVVLAVIGWFFFYHSSGDDSANSLHHGKNGAPVPVGVATARTGDMPVYLKGLGAVTPRRVVTAQSRVAGELISVLFKEGQLVKEGDLLAEIDPRPYEAALEQAKGQLARDQALLKNARIDLERYITLFKQDSIAKQQVDTQDSLVKQYEGTVLNDQGVIDTARVNLIYTKITSPVEGRVGLRQVDPGNIIQTSATTGIVVVTQLQPIDVLFTLPEDNIPTVMKHMQAGGQLVTEAWSRDDTIKLADGSLIAVDNQVDPTTGTLKFKAEFSNEDNTLFANQFVNIRLLLDTEKDATLIPTAAVQRGSQGTFVYLVKDKTVSLQPVTLGHSSGDIVAVEKGVSVGDVMVIDGADSLRDGSKIEIAAADGKSLQAAEKPSDDGEHKHHKHKDDSDKGSP
jgi:membrane fusion protein, multidrug efflux system